MNLLSKRWIIANLAKFLPGVLGIKAHAGFLYVAQNIAEPIQDAIRSYTGPVNSILFTGHSAGGAVAALLYLHFQLTHALGNINLLLFSFISE